MTYLFKTMRSDGSVAIDAGSKTGVFVEMLTISGSSGSGTKSYPAVPGGYLYCVNVDTGSHDFAVDTDGSGYGRIIWVQRAGGSAVTRLMVFARRINQTNTYSLALFNSAGDTLADYDYPVPQYAGSVQPSAQATQTYATVGGLSANSHQAPPVNFRPGTNRLVFVNLPDSGTQDIWYYYLPFIPSDNTTGFTMAVSVFCPFNVPYQVPTFHVYSLENPLSSSDTNKITVRLGSGALVYDSGAENMYVVDSTIVNYPTDPAATVSYTLALPAVAGMVIPYFFRDAHDTTNRDQYVSAVKRVGNVLTFRSVLANRTSDAGNPVAFTTLLGTPANSMCMVVDVSQLGGGSVAGQPVLGGAAPFIVMNPSDQTVAAGAAAYFSINASGAPTLTYAWFKTGSGTVRATTFDHSFTAVLGDSGSSYYCVVTNGLGTATTAAAILTVSASGGATFPSYIAISGEVFAEDDAATFQIYSGGSVDGTNTNGATLGVTGWANGTGSGSLYEVSATKNSSFNIAPGSAQVSTWINCDTNPAWTLRQPVKVGLSTFGDLMFTIRLISTGAVVTSGPVHFECSRP
jgi:hypothetical protein